MGILGHSSGFPCPICLVPRLEQGDLLGSWQNRTVLGAENPIARASEAYTQKARDGVLLEQSLRASPVRDFA